MNKKERILELIKELNQYSYQYYVLDNPTISDKNFDAKYDELKKLELETGFIMSNSPTQKVGFEVMSKLQKVEHKIPLKSLDKTKSVQDIIKFAKGRELIAMLKADGLTCEIDYSNGELIEASTRGNSIIGEKITHNAKTFKNIPLKLKDNVNISLSGESVIFVNDFEEINNKLSEDEKYKTPRNLVAGSVRQLSSEICSKRNVNFLAFNILSIEGVEIKNKSEQLQLLGDLGFYVIPNIKVRKDDLNDESLTNIIEGLKKSAKELNIPIDGIVFTFNDTKYANSLGETSHHPLHSISFKFYDEIENTVLRSVEWQVSKYGNLTPVANFDTVIIDGTEVSKASLHNLNFIEEKKLNIGCNIGIVKRNQIIPYVEVNYDTNKGILEYPSECPCCHSKTEIRQMKEGKFLYCTNRYCKDRLVQLLKHFVSRDALNINGISEAILETFISKGFIKSFADIFRIEKYKKEIINLDGFGIKSYNNMIKSIEKVRTETKLENFLYALSIPNVGKSTAKDLAKRFKTIENFINAKNADIISISDIGDVTTESILTFRFERLDLIYELLNYITFKTEEKKPTNFKDLSRLTFVITGSVTTFKNRDEFKALVESLNGKCAGSVSKSTSYLVSNESSSSSKYQKATSLGVKVITESEFNELIDRVV